MTPIYRLESIAHHTSKCARWLARRLKAVHFLHDQADVPHQEPPSIPPATPPRVDGRNTTVRQHGAFSLARKT